MVFILLTERVVLRFLFLNSTQAVCQNFTKQLQVMLSAWFQMEIEEDSMQDQLWPQRNKGRNA